MFDESMLEETQPSFQLTQDQQNFLEQFQAFLSDDTTQSIVLSGGAGSGKTYVTTEAVKMALENGARVIGVACPTHKAVGVIADKLVLAGLSIRRDVWTLKPDKDDLGFDPNDHSVEGRIINRAGNSKIPEGIYVGTIHQFLSARPMDQSDPEDDNVEFTPQVGYCEQPLASCDLMCIDEGSMIGREFYGYITESSKSSQVKVLFIGDQYQLFPVERDPELSKVFRINPKVELKQVVRYSGQILKEAVKIRELMEDGLNIKAYTFRAQESDDFTIVKDRRGYRQSDWFKLLVTYALEQRSRRMPQDWLRVLVYRRKTMEEINQAVREELFGIEANNQFFQGEWLFTHGNCSSYVPMETRLESIQAGKNPEVLSRLGNSRDFQIMKVRQYDEVIPNPLPHLINFPYLVQPCNIVTIRAWNNETDRFSETEFAVLTAPQLKVYTSNRDILENIIRPKIEECDYGISRSRDQSQKTELIKTRQLLDKFLKNYAYCYNVAEETIRWIKDPVKPEDEGFTRETVEYGRTVRKRAICKLQPALCITTHKSQGSTLNHVFINYADFFAARNDLDTMYRLLYTALTRSCESVKIYSMY